MNYYVPGYVPTDINIPGNMYISDKENIEENFIDLEKVPEYKPSNLKQPILFNDKKPQEKTKICRFYSSKRKCKFAEKCKFAHESDKKRLSGFDGNCRWGDECKFQHVPADSLSDEELRYHLEYGTKVLEGHLKKNGLYPSCTKLKRQKAKIMAKRKMRRMLENAGKKQNGRINSNGTFSEDEVTDYSNDESC